MGEKIAHQILFAALVFGAITIGFSGWSQEPAPGAGEPRQPEQTQTDPAQKPSTSNQQGTAAPPIIVNVHPAPKTEAEAAEERRERHEKADLDRRLVELTAELAHFTAGLFYATAAVAIATVFLVIATGGLGYFGWRQSKDMKSSVRVAEAAADAAQLNARAAIGVELPVLQIERMLVFSGSGTASPIPAGPLLPPKKTRPSIRVFNLGRTHANIVRLCIDRGIYKTLPDRPEYNRVFHLTQLIKSGEEQYLSASSDMILTDDDIATLTNGARLWYFGFIDYRDFLGFGHIKGFCYRWYRGRNRQRLSDRLERPTIRLSARL